MTVCFVQLCVDQVFDKLHFRNIKVALVKSRLSLALEVVPFRQLYLKNACVIAESILADQKNFAPFVYFH